MAFSFFLFVLNKLFLYINGHVKFFYRFLFLEVREGKFNFSFDAFVSSENAAADAKTLFRG